MKSTTHIMYTLEPEDTPSVTIHEDCVSIHLNNYDNGGTGFMVMFYPIKSHIESAKKLVEYLELLAKEERVSK